MGVALDHLVVACPDLDAAIDWFAAATGVRPATGGSHVGRGTANALVGLTGAGRLAGGYLELIGPDPAQPEPQQPRPLRVDDVQVPTLVTWAVRPDDLDRAVAVARERGYDPGVAGPMTRRAADGTLLRWRLTPATFPSSGGVVPFLIDWGLTPHPTSRALPTVELADLRATYPDPSAVLAMLSALDVELPTTVGDIGLAALLRTPRGDVQL